MALDLRVQQQVPASAIIDAIAQKRVREQQIQSQRLNDVLNTVKTATDLTQGMVQDSVDRQHRNASAALAGILSKANQPVAAPGAQFGPQPEGTVPFGEMGPQPPGALYQPPPVPYGSTPDFQAQARSLALKTGNEAPMKDLSAQLFPNPLLDSKMYDVKQVQNPDGSTGYSWILKSPGMMGAPGIAGAPGAPGSPGAAGRPASIAVPGVTAPQTFFGAPNQTTGNTDIIGRNSGKVVGTVGGVAPVQKDSQGNPIQVPYRNPAERKELISSQTQLNTETKNIQDGLDSVDRLRKTIDGNIPASQFDMKIFKVRMAGLSRITQQEINNETGDPSFIQKFLQHADTFATGKMTKQNMDEFRQEADIIEKSGLTALNNRIDGATNEYVGLHPGIDPGIAKQAFSSRYKPYLDRGTTTQATGGLQINQSALDAELKRRNLIK